MDWLLSKPLRPLIGLAAAASLLLNLALTVPALYMLQVFDRVFASRSVETLVMLGLAALLACSPAAASRPWSCSAWPRCSRWRWPS